MSKLKTIEQEFLDSIEYIEDELEDIDSVKKEKKYLLRTGEIQGIETCLKIIRKHKRKKK